MDKALAQLDDMGLISDRQGAKAIALNEWGLGGSWGADRSQDGFEILFLSSWDSPGLRTSCI